MKIKRHVRKRIRMNNRSNREGEAETHRDLGGRLFKEDIKIITLSIFDKIKGRIKNIRRKIEVQNRPSSNSNSEKLRTAMVLVLRLHHQIKLGGGA